MIGLPAAADTLVLFVAASLTKPLQPVLDAFTAQTGIVIQRESGASLEHVRKITELHRVPDVLLLADADVFPRYLVPAHATWYADFARNRMVVAYTPKSKHAGEITPDNWTSILQRGDVEIGRTDPSIAPVGYRTLLMFQLAERFYRTPNLAASLLEHSPDRNIRPNAAELAALLAAGELDYIYDYQSVAESNGFRYVALPPAIDLGDAQREKEYESVSVQVRGASPGATTTVRGEPILYGMTVPRAAPHPSSANRFVAYLFSPGVLKQLRDAHVDMVANPVVHGSGAPASLRGGDGR
jgi:molybdate/tungstate transport system substrate-binding protein